MEVTFDIAEDELQIFLAEANEHLQVLDEGLVRLERERDDAPLLQALFRSAHTLKGSAGAIGHRRMADLTHAMETVLDGVRKNTLSVEAFLMDALLESLDALRLLLHEVVDGQVSPVEVPILVARLAKFAQRSAPNGAAAAPSNGHGPSYGPAAQPSAPETPLCSPSASAAAPLAVRVEFAPDCFASAARAFQAVMTLQGLGEIVTLQPEQAVIETSAAVSVLSAQVNTRQTAAAVCDALKDIPGVARLTAGAHTLDLTTPTPAALAPASVTPAAPEPAAIPPGLALLDESAQRLGEFLVTAGYITSAQLQTAIDTQAASDEPHPMIGQTLVRLGFLTQSALDHAIAQQISQLRTALQATQTPTDKSRGRAEQTVRTSVERLDSLMNLVGELITGRNRLYQLHRIFEKNFHGDERVDELGEAALNLGRLTDQLQEEVMRIRMLPVASVFNKFPRLVRDLARQTGKEVELVMRGEDTELDRSVIESISDPLIHMLRNAIDHGLESPEERRAAGKPERGIVLLTARHEEGRILLTVEDDGKGIDLERVKASAVRKGLLSEIEAAALTQAQTVDLIFAPGLSTAKAVSGLSGRGVGMDIVRSNIERLNGTITVETTLGEGTKFQVALPLTLAIIPALLVQAGGQGTRSKAGLPVFAIPLASVMEALHLSADEIHTINGRPVTLLRGSVLPLLRLDEALGLPAPVDTVTRGREYVVAVRWGQTTMGLRVDRLVGEQEVVIKSLGTLVGETVGVAGAAILGDGQIALIADVPGLFKLAGA